MRLTTSPHQSGLLLAMESADERLVERELGKLDPSLFLSKEIDRQHGRYVWIVLQWLSDDTPAVRVLEWRDPYGRPLGLSLGILERLKTRENEGVTDFLAGIEQANAAHEAQVEREATEIAEESAAEVARAGRIVLHRSPGLVAARRRQRAKGGAA